MLKGPTGQRSRGQALAEFAIVAPVFIAMIAAIIQFGLLFWTQNTLTQVVRDTARWQVTQITACDSVSSKTTVATKANEIASQASLLNYSSDDPFVLFNPKSAPEAWPAEGVAVSWLRSSGADSCPPKSNTTVWYVDVLVRHTVPTFFPGMQFLPQLGTCDENGCRIALTSSVRYRMEPAP